MATESKGPLTFQATRLGVLHLEHILPHVLVLTVHHLGSNDIIITSYPDHVIVM